MDRAVRKEWAAWWNGYTYNVGHTVSEDIIAVLISRDETVSQHVSIDVLCGRYGR